MFPYTPFSTFFVKRMTYSFRYLNIEFCFYKSYKYVPTVCFKYSNYTTKKGKCKFMF